MNTEINTNDVQPRRSLNSVLETVTTLAVLIAAATVIWANFLRPQPVSAGRTLPVPTEPVSIAGAPTRGLSSARAALIVFSDFECPYCKTFARQTLPAIEKEFVETGQLTVVFRHLPLDGHPLGLQAAKASDCAAQQGQFWNAHDALFGGDSRIDEVRIQSLATSLRVDASAYKNCSARPTSVAIERDRKIAERLGIGSTPSFLVGSILPDQNVQVRSTIVGGGQLEKFRVAIKSTLASR